MGDGALKCSLYLSLKFLADSPNILIITIHPVTLVSIYDPTFFEDWILLSFGAMRRSLMVLMYKLGV